MGLVELTVEPFAKPQQSFFPARTQPAPARAVPPGRLPLIQPVFSMAARAVCMDVHSVRCAATIKALTTSIRLSGRRISGMRCQLRPKGPRTAAAERARVPTTDEGTARELLTAEEVVMHSPLPSLLQLYQSQAFARPPDYPPPHLIPHTDHARRMEAPECGHLWRWYLWSISCHCLAT